MVYINNVSVLAQNTTSKRVKKNTEEPKKRPEPAPVPTPDPTPAPTPAPAPKKEADKTEKKIIPNNKVEFIRVEEKKPKENEPKPDIIQKPMDTSDKKITGSTTISGELWTYYRTPFGNNTSYRYADDFKVSRTYINLIQLFDKSAMLRITLDISQIGTTTQNTYLKYAYGKAPLSSILPINIPVNISFGLFAQPWIKIEEGSWSDTIALKPLADTMGIMPSADFGVGLDTKFSIFGSNDIEATFVEMNGTGYKTAKNDSQKTSNITLKTDVVKSPEYGTLKLGVYGSFKGFVGDYDINKKYAGAIIAFKNNEYGTIFAEYGIGKEQIGTRDSKKYNGEGFSGWSTGFEIKPMQSTLTGLSIIGQYMKFDPNESKAGDEKNAWILGFSYQQQSSDKDSGLTTIMSKVKFVLDYENRTNGTAPDDRFLNLHIKISY